jgi:hypothetical protein
LIGYAEHTFRLDQRQADGRSLRDHLESLEKQTGTTPQGLIAPEIHPAGQHLWGWFQELHVARGSSGFGPSAISYSEIQAWAALNGMAVSPWEVSVLKRLDGVYLNHMGEESERRAAQDRANTNRGKS